MNDRTETAEQPTIDVFVASMRHHLAHFEDNWKTMREKKPEDWPEKMGQGDWYDQFLIFMASGDVA